VNLSVSRWDWGEQWNWSEDPLNFSESGWWGRICSEMKTLIPILFCLLVLGCGKQKQADTNESTPTTNTKKANGTTAKPVKELTTEQKQKALRDSAVGTYEGKDVGDTLVFLDNGVFEAYEDGEKEEEGKWKIINKEIYFEIDDEHGFLKINKDGSLTEIARIRDGERTDFPKERQITFKKIKDTKPTAPKNDDKITYDDVSDEEAITGADKLVRVCVKALAEKNFEMLLQQNPNSLPDEDYKQWTKALWFANLGQMKKEVSDMLKVLEDPEMKAFLVKLQTEPDKVIEDELEQQLEMRKISMNGPRMEIEKKEFIVERNKLAVAESDWGKVEVSKVKIVRFRQRKGMKEIPFPNRQVEVTLEVDGREIENTIRMEIVKLPKHGWKYTYLEIHLKPRNPKK